jgi:hypothetical protein
MKNKNALYVVLGISAGVVAYYIFCKNKNNKRLVGVASDNTGEKPVETKTNKGGIGGGIFSPVIPKYTTPVATTTPLVVNVTSTPSTGTSVSSTPTTTSVTTPTSTSVTTPITTPVTTPISTPVSTPVSTTISDVVSKPTLEPTSPTKPATEVISKPISVTELSNSTTPVSRVDATRVDATQIKSSFQGVGSLCFEVGDCLYDL